MENWGTEQKLLCVYKSKFNPRLEPRYALTRDDNVGRLAKWTYNSVLGNPRITSLLKSG